MNKLRNILAQEGLVSGRRAAGDEPQGRLEIRGLTPKGEPSKLKGSTLQDFKKIWRFLEELPGTLPDLRRLRSDADRLRTELGEAELRLEEGLELVAEMKAIGITDPNLISDPRRLGDGFIVVVKDEEGAEWMYEDGKWYPQ